MDKSSHSGLSDEDIQLAQKSFKRFEFFSRLCPTFMFRQKKLAETNQSMISDNSTSCSKKTHNEVFK